MAKRLQHRGGTTSQHSSFTGAVREVTVDTDKNTLVVHDGATAGGHPLATTTNFTSTGIDDNATSTAITIDSSDNVGIGGSPQTDILLSLRPTGYTDNSLFLGSGAYGIYGTKFYSQSETTGGATSATQLVTKIETNVNGRSDNRWYSFTHATATSDFQYFSTGGSERLRINGSGNVGIGTSTPFAKINPAGATSTNTTAYNAVSPPAAGQLDVRSTDAYTTQLGGKITFSGIAGTGGVALSVYGAIQGYKENATINNAGGGLILSTTANGPGTLNERMRITSTGNVGIDTASPATELDISSGAITTGTKRYITLTSLNSSSSEIGYADIGVTFNQNAAGNESGGMNFRCFHSGTMRDRYIFGAGAGDTHAWYTGAGTERMRIA
jgi:hypothetical protein